ncbi:hypothetical protein SNE40_002876 [Patella caerulea]|uniref:Uncharacterized protein n=1 Tax=Patella caerulea TaxID=87958 RepID=A0AAN8Q483_PATCE
MDSDSESEFEGFDAEAIDQATTSFRSKFRSYSEELDDESDVEYEALLLELSDSDSENNETDFTDNITDVGDLEWTENANNVILQEFEGHYGPTNLPEIVEEDLPSPLI